MPIAAECQDIQ